MLAVQMRILPCTHRPPCPGCPRYGEAGLASEASILLAEFADRSGARLDPVVEGAPLGYRIRARLAVRGRAASPKLGIFQEGSHSIADIPSCTIHHPRINLAARAVRDAIRRTATAPYADRPHVGLLRYVQIVAERSTGRVQVVLVANDTSEQSLLPMAAALVPALGDKLHSLWWNGNAVRTNTIFGDQWRLLAGEEAVKETIGGADVFFPPGAFGQSNLDLADRLVTDVQARVGRIADGMRVARAADAARAEDAVRVVDTARVAEDAIVAELYCGVGAIGLGLVERVREVRFNEVSPHGLRGLEAGLAALPLRSRARTSVESGEAAGAVQILRGASCVIVDPPRKGLDDAVISALRAERPSQLLYVSCDIDSLVRDADRLVESGVFRVARLTPYAMFPYTDHVETLAEFTT